MDYTTMTPHLVTRTHATASFHAAIKRERHPNSTGKKKIHCVYCKGKHPPTTCPEVTEYQKWLELFANQIFVSIVWGITKSHGATPSSNVSIADTNTTPACAIQLRAILLNPANQRLTQ